jgi:hypothetical protein
VETSTLVCQAASSNSRGGTASLPAARGRGQSSERETIAKPTEEQIRQRAQEIWEENHRLVGRDDEFWYQAERELSQGVTPDEKSETFLE